MLHNSHCVKMRAANRRAPFMIPRKKTVRISIHRFSSGVILSNSPDMERR